MALAEKVFGQLIPMESDDAHLNAEFVAHADSFWTSRAPIGMRDGFKNASRMEGFVSLAPIVLEEPDNAMVRAGSRKAVAPTDAASEGLSEGEHGQELEGAIDDGEFGAVHSERTAELLHVTLCRIVPLTTRTESDDPHGTSWTSVCFILG